MLVGNAGLILGGTAMLVAEPHITPDRGIERDGHSRRCVSAAAHTKVPFGRASRHRSW